MLTANKTAFATLQSAHLAKLCLKKQRKKGTTVLLYVKKRGWMLGGVIRLAVNRGNRYSRQRGADILISATVMQDHVNYHLYNEEMSE